MNFIKTAIDQPITVTVCMLLALVAGGIAMNRVPVQMTPSVDDTVIAVTTRWENASPQEMETEVVDKQEEKLQGIADLRSMTSTSRNGQGQVRLEFRTGVNKEVALREVSDKLREVSEYPEHALEPVIEASDPESNDYIAWFLLRTPDKSVDIQTLSDFIEDRVKPRMERVSGLSEVNVFGGRKREAQVHFDPLLMAQHQVTIADFVAVLRASNVNLSGGALSQGKYDVRVRTVSRFNSPESILNTVIRQDDAGPVYVRDVAVVQETYKEELTFVRHMGQNVLALNFQREPGSNLIQVMSGLQDEVKRINASGGVLDVYAQTHSIEGGLEFIQVYDQTDYVNQAFSLVQSNIIFGGILAVIILAIFLRSLRSIGIIAISIPVAIISSIVVMVAMGRSINVISMAGMAFSVGMVVDNAIVVLENIFRHQEMGKSRMAAAYDGAMEVKGAVLASTLTTMLVFIPILLIEEMSGQLLRDISLAIVTAVGLSFIISLSVIPSGAAMFLKVRKKEPSTEVLKKSRNKFQRLVLGPFDVFRKMPELMRRLSFWLNGGTLRRIVLIVSFALVTIIGIFITLPPIDYLPSGNRNLTFGLMIPPPGYNINQMKDMGERVEARIRPFWVKEDGEPDRANMYQIPTGFTPDAPMVTPPAIKHYFLVGSDRGILFHGGISDDDRRVADLAPLFQMATSQAVLPGTFGFAFQFPLFRLGGSSGGAVKIDLVGADLEKVKQSAGALLGSLMQDYGPYSTRPDPSNFNIPTPEMQVVPNMDRMSDVHFSVADLGQAVQANSDGLIIGDYELDNDIIDLKLISSEAIKNKGIDKLDETVIATANGDVVQLGAIADFNFTNAPEQIKRVNRQRAVTLEFTPPRGLPLQVAIDSIEAKVAALKQSGDLDRDVDVLLAGSASRLNEVKEALLGDGSFVGLTTSALFLALVVVYLLMCVLFQSWLYPMVIMVSVPLATLGGFLGLYSINVWSNIDRYMPVQNMDVLTILGLVILAGVVVNNAILIVAQTLNFEKSEEHGDITYREAISLAVESRVRPIFMSTLTSVGGMLPLVLMPGAGSELYRGLGAVVVGGLLVSTIFTLILVPALLGLLRDLKEKLRVVLLARHASILLAACLLFTSCGVGKDYARPEIETPQQWHEELGGGLSSDAYDLRSWWTQFGDDDLNWLMKKALEQSYDIRIASSRVREARAKRGAANAALYPQLDLVGSYTRQRSSENIDSAYKSGGFSTNLETQAIDVYSLGFDAGWEIDFFGGLGRKKEASVAELQMIEAEMHDVLISMLAEIAVNYVELRALQQRVHIIKSNIESQSETLHLTRARFEAGLSDELDTAQAQTNVATTQTLLPALEEELQHVLNRLAVLTAEQPGALHEQLSVVKAVPVPPQKLALGAPADLLRRRPDIRMAERQVAMQTALVGAIESELYPKFFVNGSFNVSASDVGDLFQSGSTNYGLGPVLSWKIFSAGRIKNQVRAQGEREQQAMLRFYKTVLYALAEVEDGIISYARERERSASLQNALNSAERAVSIAKAQYQQGITEFDSVLQTERALFNLQDQVAISDARLSTNVIALYKSLGGGWKADDKINK